MVELQANNANGDSGIGLSGLTLNDSFGKPPLKRRAKDIIPSIGLLAMAVVLTAMVFIVKDPRWIKWVVGLVLAFNILVAARVALSKASRPPMFQI